MKSRKKPRRLQSCNTDTLEVDRRFRVVSVIAEGFQDWGIYV